MVQPRIFSFLALHSSQCLPSAHSDRVFNLKQKNFFFVPELKKKKKKSSEKVDLIDSSKVPFRNDMKDFGSVFERVHRCVTTVVKYRNCVVDFGPEKSIHYPELNACFLKNNLNCNVIHFGYAIPISLLPTDDNPNLVEVVFDGSQDIDPIVADYLLRNHPEFKDIRNGISPLVALEDDAIAELKNNFRDFTDHCVEDDDKEGDEMKKKMATMAKHDHLRNFSEPEEDIAAIAKQISDHAEAIYQTWKSRGLAPTEILTCHSNATAADKFGSTLTPKAKNPGLTQINPSQPDILGDAKKLEKLVNNFVVEDKARLAATKNAKPAPKSNTIQYALQKFEKQANDNNPNRVTVPKTLGTDYSYRTLPQPTQISRPVPANQIQLQSLDTIEIILPEEIVHKNAPLQKRAGSVEFNGSNTGTTGLTTWPLKNKAISQDNMKMRKDSLKTSPKNSEEYLSEVQREEEKLINALKCGVIINEESSEKIRADDSSKGGERPTSMLKNAMAGTINGDCPKIRNAPTANYAKNRFKIASETAEPKNLIQNQTIGVVKNRFESAKKVQEEVSWRNKEVKEWGVSEDDGDKNKVKLNIKNRHGGSENVPHPELTTQQKQHIRQVGTNPVRPFLTRGSVAERVLIFEKCPTELLLDKRRSGSGVAPWRTGSEIQSKAQVSVSYLCFIFLIASPGQPQSTRISLELFN